MTLLQQPLFHIGRHYITVLGLIAFVAFFVAGVIIARFLQSQIVRRFFSRFKIDTNFIAIVTTILSLAAIVFFTVTAVNAAGIPLAWTAPLPKRFELPDLQTSYRGHRDPKSPTRPAYSQRNAQSGEPHKGRKTQLWSFRRFLKIQHAVWSSAFRRYLPEPA